MMEWLDQVSNGPPELIWGILTRAIGLVFFISFASLTTQVMPAAGSAGITPVAMRLRIMKKHFPTWKRFIYFPTLLWINDSDAALRALAWTGLACAASIIVGGPHTPYAFIACYLLYLSLDRAIILIYPWDCMLFEAGFWAMFLPPLHTLPDVTAVAAPDPAHAWVYRLLVFRVIFGFGKFKFLGTTSKDTGYLKGFYINQPLPSPIGWLSQKLPMPMLKFALFIMFLSEIPLPFAVFFPGPWSAIAASFIIVLMLAIWVSGTFGYFNFVMIVCALSWFDTQTAQAFSWASFFSLEGNVFMKVLIALHTFGAILSFPFNSFCANTWLLWSVWLRVKPGPLMWPIYFYRFFHSMRWLHAFGVFPPHTVPGVKIVPVMEVTWDDKEWETLDHQFSPTRETSRPPFCAPHHARLDQALIYEVFGLNDASVMRNFVGWWEPYGHGRVTGAMLLAYRVLEGTVPGNVFYNKKLEKERGRPPIRARVRTYMLEPTTIKEMLSTGRWWKKTLVGPHTPPMELRDGFWDDLIPPPELWHFDDRIWLRRSHFHGLMQRAIQGEDPHQLVLEEVEDITQADVDAFWNDFLPTVSAFDKHDWTGLRKLVYSLREKYGRKQLYKFERIAGRYGTLLFGKLEPMFLDQGFKPAFGKVKATLDVKTYYHFGLLTRHIVSEGKARYDEIMANPRLAIEEVPRMTMQSGNFFDAIFRFEVFVFQSYKLRLLENYLEHAGRPQPTEKQKAFLDRIDSVVRRTWGAVEMVEFLKTQFKGPEDVLDVPENWPKFAMTDSGEVVRLPLPQEQPAPPPPGAEVAV